MAIIELDNYRDKYLKSGRVGALLVDHFFASLHELVHLVRPRPNSVLEVGAGDGYSTQRIVRMLSGAASLEASELRAEGVLATRQLNPDVPVQQESVYQLNRGDKSFDLVVCLEVFEHLDDPGRALCEIARVARHAAVISVPREPLWRALNVSRGKYLADLGNTPGHVQHWSAASFGKFVSSSFNVLAVRKPIPWTMMLLEPHTR